MIFHKHGVRARDAATPYSESLHYWNSRTCKPGKAQNTSLMMLAISNVTRLQQNLQKSAGWSQLFCHPTNKICCCNMHWGREKVSFADRKGILPTKGFMPWRIIFNISNEPREWTCSNVLSVPQVFIDISESQFNSLEKQKKKICIFFIVFQSDPSTVLLMDRLIIIAPFSLIAT